MERQPAPTKHESERPSMHQCRSDAAAARSVMPRGRSDAKGPSGEYASSAAVADGNPLDVKDPGVLVITDALCEQTDTPKENRVHLVCDKNTDALNCERIQKPSL